VTTDALSPQEDPGEPLSAWTSGSEGWDIHADLTKSGETASISDIASTVAEGAAKSVSDISGTMRETDYPAMLSDESGWQVGEVIGGVYEVLGGAKGAMGTVHFVRHRDWDAMLAVKTPHAEVYANATGRARYIREAETWIGMGSHSNIARAFHVAILDGVPRIFVEYAGGGDLRHWMKDAKIAGLEGVLHLAIQVAEGMAHAHDQGVIHRDLKPENILMTRGGTAKVTDFGLAKGIGEETSAIAQVTASGGVDVTLHGAVLGTPLYMAPEQWRDSSGAGPAVDIYAFGCILHELFWSVPPFEAEGGTIGDRIESLRRQHTECMPAAASREVTARFPVSPEARDLALACLRKDPSLRPSGFRVLAAELRRMRGGGGAAPVEPVMPTAMLMLHALLRTDHQVAGAARDSAVGYQTALRAMLGFFAELEPIGEEDARLAAASFVDTWEAGADTMSSTVLEVGRAEAVALAVWFVQHSCGQNWCKKVRADFDPGTMPGVIHLLARSGKPWDPGQPDKVVQWLKMVPAMRLIQAGPDRFFVVSDLPDVAGLIGRQRPPVASSWAENLPQESPLLRGGMPAGADEAATGVALDRLTWARFSGLSATDQARLEGDFLSLLRARYGGGSFGYDDVADLCDEDLASHFLTHLRDKGHVANAGFMKFRVLSAASSDTRQPLQQAPVPGPRASNAASRDMDQLPGLGRLATAEEMDSLWRAIETGEWTLSQATMVQGCVRGDFLAPTKSGAKVDPLGLGVNELLKRATEAKAGAYGVMGKELTYVPSIQQVGLILQTVLGQGHPECAKVWRNQWFQSGGGKTSVILPFAAALKVKLQGTRITLLFREGRIHSEFLPEIGTKLEFFRNLGIDARIFDSEFPGGDAQVVVAEERPFVDAIRQAEAAMRLLDDARRSAARRFLEGIKGGALMADFDIESFKDTR
jgi:hypothetical protein